MLGHRIQEEGFPEQHCQCVECCQEAKQVKCREITIGIGNSEVVGDLEKNRVSGRGKEVKYVQFDG